MTDAESEPGTDAETGVRPGDERVVAPSRRDPIVRTIVASWRALTGGSAVRDGGRRTLVACSGGADSAALLLALASVSPRPEVCHVVHDMRPAGVARLDAARTRDLCAALGVVFHEGAVSVAGAAGNDEANARAERYTVLARIASARGLRFVATGHHADDQLETAIMRMVRGAGVRGMAGIRSVRGLSPGVTLVRPMLGSTHEDAVSLCRAAGWAWNEDATNTTGDRLRSALRTRVLPALRSIEPSAAVRAARTCASLESADSAIGAWADSVLAAADESGSVSDARLRLQYDIFVELPDSVIESVLRRIYARIVGDVGLDRLSWASVNACIRGVRDHRGGWAGLELAELELRICEGWVEFCKK